MRNRFAVLPVLISVCMGLVASAVSMPMHPDLLESLRAEDGLSDVVRSLQAAREKGVFEPNPEPPSFVGKPVPFDQPAIVLIVDFDDNPADTLNYPTAHYDSLLFSQGIYPTGSMRDFYLENSYGTVNITGAVTVWIRMPQTYAYYANGQYGFGDYPNNAQRLTEDAVQAADSLVDFKPFDADSNGFVDAIFIVHAGPGAEVTGDPWDIWSHAWRTSYPIAVDDVLVRRYSMEPEDGRIGVFSHELGHVFGLPDLYDYGYDSNGLGGWTVMAGGSWGNGGRTPVHFDAWCKTKLGFITPYEPAAGTLSTIEFPWSEYTPFAYKVYLENQPFHEYFIVENRSNVGFDLYLPGPGLCVYHCDDTVSTGNDLQWYPGYTDSGHYLVAMEQADGQYGLEKNYGSNAGDAYPGTFMNRTLNDTTIPDTRTYSFVSTGVCVEDVSDPADTMTANLCVGTPGIMESFRSRDDSDLAFGLLQSRPNPFYNRISISFAMPASGHARLDVFDVSGRLVATPVDGFRYRGMHEAVWIPGEAAGGMYFCVLRSAGRKSVSKVTLLH
jgi:immune inhibitor A